MYQYDNVNRLINLANKINGGADISTFAYSYDKAGNRLSMTTQAGIHNYTYDKLYQLKSVDYPQGVAFPDQTFNYDGVGNRTQTVNGGTTNYASNNLNQYSTVGSTNYAYDSNGNLSSDGTFTYAYDYENRLTSATKSGTTANYKYDAFGRRIEKTVNGTITKFIYDGDQIIAEYDGAGALISKFVYGAGIDEVLKMEKGGTSYYYHYDGLGSVTNLTDSTGQTSESYSYDAFGKPSTTSTLGNRYMFTGREYDTETELYYYRARYYSPTLGRFLQRDQLGYFDDINLYRYCANNPINFLDPFGWDKEKPWLEKGWEWWSDLVTGNDPILSKPDFWEGAYRDWVTIGNNLKYIGFRIAVPTSIFSLPPKVPYLVNPVGRPPTNLLLKTLRREITFIERKWWPGAGRYTGIMKLNKALTGATLGGGLAYIIGAAMSGSMELPKKLEPTSLSVK